MKEQKRQFTLEADSFAGQFYSPAMRGRERMEGLVPFGPRCLQNVQRTGYDALVQSSASAMRMALQRDLTAVRAAMRSERSLTSLTGEGREAVEAVVDAVDRREPVIAWPFTLRRVRVAFDAQSVEVRLRVTSVHAGSGREPQVTVRCAAELVALVRETDASYAARVDRTSFNNAPPPYRGRPPAGSDRIEDEVVVANTEVRLTGPVALSAEPARFLADARVSFTDATISIDEVRADESAVGATVFGPLMNELATEITRGWGVRRVVPTAQFFGDVTTRPAGITRFEAVAIGTGPALWSRSWLTLAFRMTPGDTAPTSEPIEPFTGSKTMGVFLSEPVVTATILSRWASVPRRSVELNVPVRLVGERVVYGNARVRYTLGEAAWASLAYGTETYPDNVGVQGRVESQALAAELDGEDVTGELGDLASVQRKDEFFRVFATASGVEQRVGGLGAWLQHIGRHVMTPALKPLAAPWRFANGFEATLSAPLSSLVCQGDLL